MLPAMDPSGNESGGDVDNLHQTLMQSPQSIDQVLSKGLLNLSLQDRNAIDEEIHGVATLDRQESPELVAESLLALSRELDAIPNDQKACYLLSQRSFETYVNTSEFRLRFLRCELFDAKKAAKRLVNFLDYAKDLFGKKVLERPLSMSDLTKDEQKLMRSGNFQVMPFRDRAGRPIFAWIGDFGLKEGSVKSRHKLTLYQLYCLSEDIESQQKGMTKLIFVGPTHNFSGGLPEWENVERGPKLAAACPIRISCIHFCLPDRVYFHLLQAAYIMTLGKNNLSRLKFHIGNEIELRYQLQTFGIPVETIPVTVGGNIKTTHLKQWIRTRKKLETLRESGDEASNRSIIVDCPRSNDVLFRPGGSFASHRGNSVFREMIEASLPEHSSATQLEKKAITQTIIETIKQAGGRYLKWEKTGWWTPVEDSQVHGKVAAAIKASAAHIAASRKNHQKVRSSTLVFQNQDYAKRRKISHFEDGFSSDGGASSSSDGSSCGCAWMRL